MCQHNVHIRWLSTFHNTSTSSMFGCVTKLWGHYDSKHKNHLLMLCEVLSFSWLCLKILSYSSFTLKSGTFFHFTWFCILSMSPSDGFFFHLHRRLYVPSVSITVMYLSGRKYSGYIEVTDGRVVRKGISVTRNVFSWSGGYEFEPWSDQMRDVLYFCPKSYLNQWYHVVSPLP